MPAPAPNNQPFPTWSLILEDIVVPLYKKYKVNVNDTGYDPVSLEDEQILDYYKKNPTDNVAILYNGKIYLSKRSIIKEQYNDETIVYECLEAVTANERTRPNVVGNIPYYNLKKIGIDMSHDVPGILPGMLPEYIYLKYIDELLDNPYPYFSVIPGDKILTSVISREETYKIPKDPKAPLPIVNAGALHCQVGQKGLTGFMVQGFKVKIEENPIEEKPNVVGGKKWKKINKKTKRTIKKSKKYNKN